MFHDPRQRTRAIGIWIAGFSVGAARRAAVGGLLLENFWWGSVFLLDVPVMALLLVLGPLLLPEFRDPRPGRLDLLSAGLSLVAVLRGRSTGSRRSPRRLRRGADAAASLRASRGAVFVHRQRRWRIR